MQQNGLALSLNRIDFFDLYTMKNEKDPLDSHSDLNQDVEIYHGVIIKIISVKWSICFRLHDRGVNKKSNGNGECFRR